MAYVDMFDQLGDYTQKIYASIIGPGNQIEGLIRSLSHLLESPYGSFQLENVHNNSLYKDELFLLNYDDSAITEYADYYVEKDPWTQSLLDNQSFSKGFHFGHQIIEDKNYINSEFYCDWGKHHGVRHAIGCGILIDDSTVMKITFQRHCDHSPFDESEGRFLNLLFPHFQQMARLSPLFENIKKRQESIFQSLNRINRPVWILDKKMNLVYCNNSADNELRQNYPLVVNRKKISTRNPLQGPDFEKKVVDCGSVAQNGKSYSYMTLRHNGELENIWLLPVMHEGMQLVMLLGKKNLPDISYIRQRHALTCRQGQICTLLMQGHDLQEIAQQLNISVNTVRNQLYVCFSKLKVKNQSELIHLLFSSSAFI